MIPSSWPGRIYFNVHNTAGAFVKQAVTPQVASGQTASTSVSLPAGSYDVYAYGYDGTQLSAPAGPHRITVAAAPGAPTGVQAEPGPESALVRWSPPGSNGGSAITGYSITAYDGTDPGADAITKPCGTGCSPSDGFAFVGLTPGHSYTFKVKATNAFGTGPLSSASPAVTVHATSSYADQVVAVAGDQSVQLSWEAQFLATSYIIKTYKGERPSGDAADSGHFVSEETVDAADTAHLIEGLLNGNPYYFTVTPVVLLLLVGQPSETSNPVVPFGLAFAPEDVQALPSDGSVIVMWNPPSDRPDGTPGDNGSAITAYRVNVYEDGVTNPVNTVEVAPEPTLAAVEGLQNGAQYSFAVQAINAAGAGVEASTAGTLSPGGRPFAPENVSATLAASRSVSVNWDPPGIQPDGTPGDNGHEITGYRVVVSPSCPSCEGTQVGQVTATTLTGLSAGTTYNFAVVAKNAFGEGPASSPAQTVAISSEIPDAPTNVVAEWDPNAPVVRVAWAAPNDNGSPITSYRVTGNPGDLEMTTSSTTAEFENLDPTFAYTFAVRATNGIGEGPASAASDPAGSPTQPPNLLTVEVTPGDRSADLKWDYASPLTDPPFGHVITVTRWVEQTPELVAEVNTGPSNSATVSVEPGEYVFAIRGHNAAGDGDQLETDRVAVWDRDEVDEWMFGHSLSEYLGVRESFPYPYSFDSDGCSVPPQLMWLTPYDVRFQDACARHDFGYQNFGRRLEISQNQVTKDEVNAQFFIDMLDICAANYPQWDLTGCTAHAVLFVDAVNRFDDGFWNDEEWSWSSCRDDPGMPCEE